MPDRDVILLSAGIVCGFTLGVAVFALVCFTGSEKCRRCGSKKVWMNVNGPPFQTWCEDCDTKEAENGPGILPAVGAG